MAIVLYDLAGRDDAVRISPFCWRVRMALAHKGLDVVTIPWRMVEKERIAASGCTTVPVIVDGDRVVGDSWKIAQYLDETYAQAPLFDSPQAKAYCFWIQQWADRVVHALLVPIILEDILRALHPRDRDYFRLSREAAYGKPLEEVFDASEQAVGRLSAALSPTRRVLRHSRFLSGSTPAYGDYILFGVFQWARNCSDAPLFRDPGDPMIPWLDRMLDLYDGLGRSAPRAGNSSSETGGSR